MTQFTTGADKRHDGRTDTELSDRAVRALTEYMSVLDEGGDVYSVTTESGSEYRVDAREGRCTCPDAEYNLAAGEQCKHELRVAFATGERAVPAWADTDAVDDQLGIHVDATPQVATDGGVIDAGDEGVILDEDEDGGRPDDCECAPCLGELPCWACYREGFDVPADVDE
jgi:hypothetical protein